MKFDKLEEGGDTEKTQQMRETEGWSREGEKCRLGGKRSLNEGVAAGDGVDRAQPPSLLEEIITVRHD